MATRPSLIPTIADLGFSSAEELQEVQARQVIYGGDQETNLLELGLVSEDQLLDALAQFNGLPRAEEGPLPIDVALTQKLRGTDLRAAVGSTTDGAPLLFVGDRLEDAQHSRVTELLGTEPQICITTRVRVEEAIAYSEGQSVEGRVSNLLDKLGTRLPPPEVSIPPSVVEPEPPPTTNAVAPPPPSGLIETAPVPLAEEPPATGAGMRPMSVKMNLLEEQAPPSIGETGPPPEGYEDITAKAAQDVTKGRKPSAGRPPRHIYSREEASEDLQSAKTRDRVIDILVHFAAAHFEYTAVFGVLSKEARGLKSSGPGAPTAELKNLQIPLDLPSVFKEARESSAHRVTRLRASGLEGGIGRDLKRPSGTDVFLLPIAVGKRTVLLLWGDNAQDGIALEELGELLSFAGGVSEALQRVLLERKRASRVAQPPDFSKAAAPPVHTTQRAPEDAPSAPPPEDLIAPVASTDDAAEAKPASSKKSITSIEPDEPQPLVRRQTQRNSAAPAAGMRPSTRPPAHTPSDAHEVAPAKKRTLTRPGQGPTGENSDSEPPPSFPAEPPKTLRGFPKVRSPSQVQREYEDSSAQVQTQAAQTSAQQAPAVRQQPMMSRRIVLDENTPRPARTSDAPPEAPLPPPVIIGQPESEKPTPAPTSARGTLLSRRAPVPEPDEDGWDSPKAPVVRRVDALEGGAPRKARSATALVQLLLEGDESTIEELIENGETAVGALIAQFPGPVEPPALPTTPASECGPILKALVALGTKATPFLTVRTADENADVRRWATFLLGELPGKDSAKAIARRLLDDSIEVRRAALSSARRVRTDVLTRRTLRAQIEQICRDTNVSIESRCSAVEALADIREHEAIPTLLQLLEGEDRAMQRATRWALSVLTRQDFGADVAAWQTFWQEHRDEDRVEWLIASLDHEQRDIRRAAGDELRALSGDAISYSEDMPEAERRTAQAAYRDWWQEAGKAASRS